MLSDRTRDALDAITSNTIMARHPDVQWRAIRDAGNVYRHKYSHVSDLLIWQTATDQLGPLRSAVAYELRALAVEAPDATDKDEP